MNPELLQVINFAVKCFGFFNLSIVGADGSMRPGFEEVAEYALWSFFRQIPSVIELRPRIADHALWLVERKNVEKYEDLPQMILRPGAPLSLLR